MQQEALIQEAKRVLDLNWRDGFTIPTNKLYPFQWNWDSGFTALGWCHVDIERAILDMETLFSGQWANGMVPHIIFHSQEEKTYFPNWDFWEASVNAGAPDQPKTSGMTQPPVHGFVVETMLNRYPDDERIVSFCKRIWPKIVHLHRFFYQVRDPEREGLTFIFHPWETGRDNSPLWDGSLARVQLEHAELPVYQRRDLQLADAAHRPTSEQYDRYVYLLELGKKHGYDGIGIFEESPCLVQDTLMNAALIKSNQSLIEMGKRFGFDTAEVEEWQQQSIPVFREKLWNEELETFCCYDLRGGHQIAHKEIGGIATLYAGIPDATQAQQLNSYLEGLDQRKYKVTPSFDPDDALFDSARYWRGPIWPQMNWMIYHGLMAYGFPQTAATVRQDLIDLVSQLGFYEYFEAQEDLLPQLDKGYGGGDFSWTAACTLDLILHTD